MNAAEKNPMLMMSLKTLDGKLRSAYIQGLEDASDTLNDMLPLAKDYAEHRTIIECIGKIGVLLEPKR